MLFFLLQLLENEVSTLKLKYQKANVANTVDFLGIWNKKRH